MLQSDLIQWLATRGTAAGGRVHHQVIPQNVVLPFIACSQISGQQPTTLDGRPLLARATIRVAIFAADYLTADQIAASIKDTLNGFRGRIGSTVVHSTRVESTTDEVSFVDGDALIKGTGLDLFFVYQE